MSQFRPSRRLSQRAHRGVPALLVAAGSAGLAACLVLTGAGAVSAATGPYVVAGTIATGGRLIAVDDSTGLLYLVDQAAGAVTLVDASTGKPVGAPLAVGASPTEIVVNPQTHDAFVLNSDATLSIIDGRTRGVKSLSVGAGAQNIAIDTLQNELYITTKANTLTVIDGDSKTVEVTPVVVPTKAMLDIAIDSTHRRAYITDFTDASVLTVDLDTRKQVGVAVKVAAKPQSIAVDPKTQLVYVSNDAAAASVVAVIKASSAPPTVSFISTGDVGSNLAVDPRTGRAFICTDSGEALLSLDGATAKILQSVDLAGSSIARDLAVSGVDGTVYATDFDAGSPTTVVRESVSPVISSGAPSGATVGVPYSHRVTATGQPAPASFRVTAGSLPDGLSIEPATGLISGKPATVGTFSFTITVRNGVNPVAGADYVIVVAAGGAATPPPTGPATTPPGTATTPPGATGRSGGSAGTLASTGFEPASAVALAVAALLGGAAMMLSLQRRRRRSVR
ncbi:putative Ig domain-containing protein [Subtercola boreus]|nr:putative Ig domain-containing protein [Subtercola boreus]